MPSMNDLGCTLDTCPISDATVDYDPTLVGNALYLALFGLVIVVQFLQMLRWKTWSYSLCMMSGCVLEVVGYVGRVQMHFNPFAPNPFLIYLICVTIAPIFFTASIYLTLSRLLLTYGPHLSPLSARTITISFVAFDIIALILQAIGGALADTASDNAGRDMGTHIMVAGLGWQVLSLLAFLAVGGIFAARIWKEKKQLRGLALVEGKEKIQGAVAIRFVVAIFIATVLILIRSTWRVAELANGFGSKLANDEVLYMVLEGAVMVLATTVLTLFHPGPVFGSAWSDAGWSWSGKVENDGGVVEKGNDVDASVPDV